MDALCYFPVAWATANDIICISLSTRHHLVMYTRGLLIYVLALRARREREQRNFVGAPRDAYIGRTNDGLCGAESVRGKLLQTSTQRNTGTMRDTLYLLTYSIASRMYTCFCWCLEMDSRDYLLFFHLFWSFFSIFSLLILFFVSWQIIEEQITLALLLSWQGQHP